MTISLSPKVLQWARVRASLGVDQLAAMVGVEIDDVQAWESNGSLPPDVAKNIADVTHTPLGFLYLSTPPDDKLPIHDFRTVGGGAIKAPTPDLLDTIYDAQRKQEWYREHLIESGAEPLSFVGSVKKTDNPATVAKKINEAMGLSTSKRSKAATKETALVMMIERVEECGLLVLRNSAVGIDHARRLSVGEFRGFALSDPYAPIVFLNSQDAKAAQLFTLAHEIAHIWLGLSGISNLTKTYSDGPAVEKFCNAVAAEMLVPTEELIQKIDGITLTEYKIGRLGTHFKVSVLVMLRRLRDIGAIDEKYFQSLYETREKRFKDQAAKAKIAAKKRGGGPSFYTTFLPRVSPKFATALVGSALEGRTLYRDALGLLGLKNTGVIHQMGKRFGYIT